MEEDAGKSIHGELSGGNRSRVDFNRGGTPLCEIVTEPDIRTSEEAAAFLKELRHLLRYLGVCDGNMEQGSFRCDANVSVRPRGQKEYGTRVELKNINSFRFVSQAIDYEVGRQINVVESGGSVTQETRLWDTVSKRTRSMRSKEEAHDYRYFPDPDLPDLILSEDYIAGVREELPELPQERRMRFVSELGISPEDAANLIDHKEVADFFETGLSGHKSPKLLANWVLNEVLRELKDQPIEDLLFGGEQLGDLVALIENGTISGKIAKDIFGEMLQTGESPSKIVESRGLKQVTNVEELEPIIDTLLSRYPSQVEEYRAGKVNLMGFFVGQVMKATQGKANPKLVNELLRKKLDG
tara:strand:- start:215 stop:1279 length:1065 start_codon:yes stop_codon:yes gene_type:complete